MRGLVSFRDRFRKGFYLNVFLHAKLEAKHGDRGKEVKAEVKKAGFKKELIVANVRRMRKLVAGLDWRPAAGRVGRLRRAQQLHRRRRQAQGRVRARGGHLAALGPHLGHRLQQRPLLAHRRRGLGPRAVGRLRPGPDRAAATARLHDEGDEKILTLTMNLADPSPGLGWRGVERKAPARTAASPTWCWRWR